MAGLILFLGVSQDGHMLVVTNVIMVVLPLALAITIYREEYNIKGAEV
jgi:hypothetical protein